MILGKLQTNHYHPFKPIFFFTVFLLVICFLCVPVSANCPSISDDPMETRVQPAPPIIMFVLDNSGSMDSEFMTPISDGTFDGKYYYLYPDEAYSRHERIYNENTILPKDNRRKWKSQWSGFNKIFYNPNATYVPWPTMEDASITELLANPSKSNAGDSRFKPGGVFYSIKTAENEIVNISNAHYFVVNGLISDEELDGGESIYLVNFIDNSGDNVLDTRVYYLFSDSDNDNVVDPGELSLKAESEIPNTVRVGVYNEDGSLDYYATVDEDIQNFANWFSYYRKRALTAKAAVARSIYNLEGVYVGIYSINPGLRKPVLFIGGATNFVLPIEAETNQIVIVDNKDSGYNETGKNWRESGASNEYRRSSRYTNLQNDHATWTPDIPSTGMYNVYVWYNYDMNRDTKALYTVSHAAGETYYRKNQRKNSSQWVLLGQHKLNKGTSGFVRVTRDNASTGNNTSADGVKFELASGSVNVDATQTLLNLLYSMDSSGGTPLRKALQNVGRYFDQDDGNDGGLGGSPYHDAEDGGACQQAFCIVMTDGFWNGDNPYVGNQDAKSGSPFDGPPYADSYSDTLADVAMYYYKKDLSSTLDNIVPTNFCDRATHQHMVTYGVSFGVTGSLNPSGYHSCLLDGGMPPWPNPHSTSHPAYKIDDLWHASVNGRGLFFSASNPQNLVSSLTDMMSNIESRISSGASVSVNGEKVNASTVLYQASYKSSSWTGDVTAYPIDPLTGEIQRGGSKIKWSASDKLQDINFNDRKILTFSSENMAGMTFRYSSLTDDQRLKLNNDSQVVDYIRGKEISGFRPRTRKLGDIVHSAPLLMGETIYAGGNDGMLHGFDVATGVERFAYVPELVLDNFYNAATPEKSFTDPGYKHVFFVDHSPVARKGVLRGIKDPGTLLVGGLGKGGKGYFGIDITNADKITSLTSEDNLAETILWEFPTSVDDDMGYSYSTPVIVRCNADLDSDGFLNDWVVVFGNGYASVNGDAALYILGVDGTLIKKINTKQTSCNGLSSPSVIDISNDGRADYAYAGDLRGNLWKFDLTGDNPAKWGVAYGTAGSPKPLIQIPGKPITSKPDVMRHCEADTGRLIKKTCASNKKLLTGFMVIFGTGKYLDEVDRISTETQSIFGIWDYGDGPDEYLGVFDKNASTNQKQLSNQSEDITLLEQTEIDNRIINGVYLRTLSQNVPDWTAVCDQKDEKNNSIPDRGINAGWYFDLPTPGERIIKDVMIRDGRIIYLTFTPNVSPCSGGGDSMILEADACSGGRLFYEVLDINGDRRIDHGDLIDIGLVDKEKKPIMVAPTGLKRPGLLHYPFILRIPDDQREMKIFSSSAGTTETLFEIAEKRGLFYWIER